MSVEDEYRINLKVRNNLLLSAIENAGYKNVAQFCKAAKLTPSCVGALINLKESPIRQDGDWTALAKRIANFLGLVPEELWTHEQTMFVLPTNQSHFSISHKEMLVTLARNTGELLEQPEIDENLHDQDRKRIIGELLDSLPPRQAKILRLRFGIDSGKEHTLEEIAEMYDLSRDRIRQIEHEAFRRLHVPERLKELKQLDDYKPRVDFLKIRIAYEKAKEKP